MRNKFEFYKQKEALPVDLIWYMAGY